MPTGYTAFIEDGNVTTAKDFILLCARNFGACISLRDEPLSKPIPEEFTESSFYRDSLQRERNRLVELRSMTEEDIHNENEAFYQRRMADRTAALEKAEVLKANYLRILEEVKAWNPPTPEHENLKAFCIEQIQISLPDTSYYKTPVERQTDSEWIEENIRECLDRISRCENEVQKERNRTDSRNKWLKDLRDSLS